jgi:hypothetical protein
MPEQWGELEDLVTAILNEAGLQTRRGVSVTLPRGSVDVDVLAEETHDGTLAQILTFSYSSSTASSLGRS